VDIGRAETRARWKVRKRGLFVHSRLNLRYGDITAALEETRTASLQVRPEELGEVDKCD
jgi:hypothetical protein